MPVQNSSPRIFIASNRLPVTVKRTDGGDYRISASSGGLVGALQGLSETTEFNWYGWPGVEVPEEDKEKVRKELRKNKAIPVFLEDSLSDKHYNGFSSLYSLSFFTNTG
jgi:trehalose 6-phosphate synthase